MESPSSGDRGLLVTRFTVSGEAADLPPPEAASAAKAVERLFDAGNYREAADAGKAVLQRDGLPGAPLVQAFTYTITSLERLSAFDEADAVIESATQRHRASWELLSAAGHRITGLQQAGYMLDGKFVRGWANGATKRLWSADRDRVRGLRLLLAARQLIPPDASASARAELLRRLIKTLGSDPMIPWPLQQLTDLTTLHDYTDYPMAAYRSNPGYPVDAAGEPVWFREPASFESAKNDGERWRFVIRELSQVDERNADEAKAILARTFSLWFSVQTMSGVVPLGTSAPRSSRRRRPASPRSTLWPMERRACASPPACAG